MTQISLKKLLGSYVRLQNKMTTLERKEKADYHQ